MYHLKNLNIEWGNTVYYIHKEGDFVIPHTHDYYEIILYKNGFGRTNYGVLEYKYKDKTLLIVPPSVNHSENSYSTTEVYCVQIKLPKNISFPLSIIYSSKQSENDFIYIESLLKTLCYKWFSENRSADLNIETLKQGLPPLNEISIRDTILELLLIINRLTLAKNKHTYAKNSLFYAKTYIERNYCKNINYAELANKIGYSYSRFRYLFTEQEGITLKQFHLGIRFVRAKELLVETNLSIKNIAQKCGFSSDIRFVLEFKNKFNISPMKYRKLFRQNINTPNRVFNHTPPDESDEIS